MIALLAHSALIVQQRLTEGKYSAWFSQPQGSKSASCSKSLMLISLLPLKTQSMA